MTQNKCFLNEKNNDILSLNYIIYPNKNQIISRFLLRFSKKHLPLKETIFCRSCIIIICHVNHTIFQKLLLTYPFLVYSLKTKNQYSFHFVWFIRKIYKTSFHIQSPSSFLLSFATLSLYLSPTTRLNICFQFVFWIQYLWWSAYRRKIIFYLYLLSVSVLQIGFYTFIFCLCFKHRSLYLFFRIEKQ